MATISASKPLLLATALWAGFTAACFAQGPAASSGSAQQFAADESISAEPPDVPSVAPAPAAAPSRGAPQFAADASLRASLQNSLPEIPAPPPAAASVPPGSAQQFAADQSLPDEPQSASPKPPAPAPSAQAPQPAADLQACLHETGDYVTHGNAVTYVIAIANSCDKRLRCEIFANVTGSRGTSLGHTVMILAAASSGEAAKQTYVMKVKTVGGIAQVSRECRVI